MRVEGLELVAAGFAKAAVSAPVKAADVVRKTAKKVEDTAKSIVPVRSGELRSSISTSHQGMSASEVGPSVRYARFVEYGSYKDAPQPFMGPALDRHSGDFVKEMKKLGGDV